MFTDPAVASVGLSQAEAQAAFGDGNVRTASVQYRATGAAWAYDRTEGMVRITAEARTGRILGGLVVGYHAPDVLQELTIAMKNALSVSQLAETIHTHPTFAEGVLLAAETWLAEGEGDSR